MTAKIPKVGDILISTEEYYSVVNVHAIFSVVEIDVNKRIFWIEVIHSTDKSRVGTIFYTLLDDIGQYYVNIS